MEQIKPDAILAFIFGIIVLVGVIKISHPKELTK